MGRLIDANALEAEIHAALRDADDINGAYILNTLDAQKTVDAVPIIRCTACKRWDSNSGLTARKCDKWGAYTKQFDYCSYGEARACG